MRKSYLIVLFLTLSACKSATKIGTECSSDADCNVKGQRCVGGFDGRAICTHPCASETGPTGCPVGYDCTVANADIGLTCNRVSYAVDATTGAPSLFGVSCATNESLCGSLGDPNPQPQCRKAEDSSAPAADPRPLEVDPQAYCTGTCQGDLDCPVHFYCGKDWDGNTKCLKRELCSDCLYNDNCPDEFPVCVPTKDGTGHYCTASCESDANCPGAGQGIAWMRCTTSTDAEGHEGNYCLHKYGACNGTGEVCDPCHSTADCALSKTQCVQHSLTKERMCTKRCTSDAMCGGPNKSGCGTIQDGNPLKLCTGDPPPHENPGIWSCWFLK